jgi:hypothetical protein
VLASASVHVLTDNRKMKINYTIDNTSETINISKSEENKILVSWTDKPSQMASLELTTNGIKNYLQSPSRLISEGNNIYLTLDKENNLAQPIFKMIETNPTKMGGMEFLKYKINEKNVGQIYIPFKDSSDDEYAIRLNIKEEDVSKLLEFVPNANEVENAEEAFKEFYYQNSPRLKIVSTSSAGDWTKIKVQLTLGGNDVSKSDVRIFAKSSSGYISNREVYTDASGIAEFKVLPYGLEQGDSMKAEFGFKYVSNIVSKDVVA